MLIIAILALTLLFALLFVGRVGAARRVAFRGRWLAVAFAGAAIFAMVRGAPWFALALIAAAALAWFWPNASPREGGGEAGDTPVDAEARRLLGLGANATAAEIRAAYRQRIAAAHPDRGGAHADAARLTAARDRLLRKLR